MAAGVEADSIVVTSVLMLSGAFTGWVGYRIRYRRDVHLIAGYQRDTDADTEALAQAIGRVVLVVAAVTILAGLLYPRMTSSSGDDLAYWAAYTMAILLLSGYALVAGRRYTATDGAG